MHRTWWGAVWVAGLVLAVVGGLGETPVQGETAATPTVTVDERAGATYAGNSMSLLQPDKAWGAWTDSTLYVSPAKIPNNPLAQVVLVDVYPKDNQLTSDASSKYDPAGTSSEQAGDGWLAPGLPPYALIAKVGAAGTPFVVGHGTWFVVTDAGRLYLAINLPAGEKPTLHGYLGTIWSTETRHQLQSTEGRVITLMDDMKWMRDAINESCDTLAEMGGGTDADYLSFAGGLNYNQFAADYNRAAKELAATERGIPLGLPTEAPHVQDLYQAVCVERS